MLRSIAIKKEKLGEHLPHCGHGGQPTEEAGDGQGTSLGCTTD